VLLLSAALRIGMLAHDSRFDVDEALYTSYARRISLRGDILLADVPLDKPPLGLAVTALSFSVFGPTEFAARLPTLFVSLLTLAAVYRLALSQAQRCAALIMLLLALSPFDLAFAATAYLDPLMTLWLMLSLLAASRDQWRAAGLTFALAVATRQSALPFAVLVIAIGVGANARQGWRWQGVALRLRRFAVPALAVGVALALWSATRAAPVDFWTLSVINGAPDRLIRANEVVPRLERWLYLLGYVTGFGPLLVVAFLAILPHQSAIMPRRELVLSVLLATGILAFLLAYWLFSFNTYDRYLHPLAPLILILVGIGARRLGRFGMVAAVAAMLPFTLAALRGPLDIGGDHGQHNGIVQLAAALQALPAGSTVYNYSLGWELGYYLGDQPAVQIVFEPTPQALARAVCANAEASYFAAPAAESAGWLAPLETGGGSIMLLSDGLFRLYRLSCSSKAWT
jgi:4-amino-4-deoxy-L-arabinose transferase-like glycosyltransferase